MKELKKFEEYFSLDVVRKQSPDKKRAENLISESDDKLSFFNKVREKLGVSELNPNYIIETCYDVLIQLLRAELLLVGYKTDSHEAEVSYMRNLGFSENEVDFMNNLRYFRNGIKYYGKRFDKDYATKVMNFLDKVYNRLKKGSGK